MRLLVFKTDVQCNVEPKVMSMFRAFKEQASLHVGVDWRSVRQQAKMGILRHNLLVQSSPASVKARVEAAALFPRHRVFALVGPQFLFHRSRLSLFCCVF